MKKLTIFCLVILFTILTAEKTYSQENSNKVLDFLSTLKFSGHWFFGYHNGETKGKSYNEFHLKRGYITFEKTFNKRISARFTQDVTIDKEGDGTGDIELRLKYIYLKYKMNDFAFFSKPYIEVGVVHRPYLDFEQKINVYRMQGKMFMERIGILTSADYGVSFFSYFGGEMDKKYQSEVNKGYPGKYGSFAIGVYNGGGYHALEENENKIVETRVTIRPLPYVIPGLQFSYIGLLGKGNTEAAPDYNANTGVLSYENKNLVFTGTYYNGKGNMKGKAISVNGNSIDQNGYSIFGEVKLGESNFNLFGRYDFFNQNIAGGDIENKVLIAGISYNFTKGGKIVIDYDKFSTNIPNKPDDTFVEIALEIKY